MADETALLPIRHPQRDLFLCDVADAVLKDDTASMEHPFFALTTQKDLRVRRYENGSNWVEVVPSVKGLATIFDKDILIFATSQLMAAKNEGRPITQEIVITARDLLVFANRHTGGHNYELLEEALERLSGTRVRTNVKVGGKQVETFFGLVDAAEVVRDESTKRVTKLYIKLSDFLFRAIQSQEVLTLAPEYFRLRKAMDRRVYEIARKHCGAQAEWMIGLELLQHKVGSADTLRAFRMSMRELTKTDHLPDYRVVLEDGDKVRFLNRRTAKKIEDKTGRIALSVDAYHDARQIAAGWDIYVLEQKWRGWMADRMEEGMEAPRDPDAAFCGFCRKWFERHGRPA
jgi:plasmid replication initiation protein